MAIDLSQKSKMIFSRREWLIVFSAALVLLISFVFPQKTFGETFWLSLLLFSVFPVIIVYFLLKEPLNNFGLSLGKTRQGLIFSVIIAVIFILLNYYLVFHSGFKNQLLVAHGIASGFLNFLLFELLIALPLHFFWETFYRGLLQLGLEKRLGNYSLVLAAALQTLSSLRGGLLIILLTLLSSLAAGIIVRQSRSIYYSTLSLWIISVSLDIMLIRLINSAST